MKLIPLTKGLFAKVDDSDYELLSKYKWLAKESDKGHFYAARNEPRQKGKKRKMIRMHSFIMGEKEGYKIDHIDRDSLNNQRNNLRFSLPYQNSANTRVRINKSKDSSKYLGVFKVTTPSKFIKKDGTTSTYKTTRWVSSIKLNHKTIKLGTFPFTPEGEVLAALAYNKAAKELKGEFANLNIISPLQDH
jgi:hypothetical protein